nr:hypothetical protein [uncultured bacterium]
MDRHEGGPSRERRVKPEARHGQRRQEKASVGQTSQEGQPL